MLGEVNQPRSKAIWLMNMRVREEDASTGSQRKFPLVPEICIAVFFVLFFCQTQQKLQTTHTSCCVIWQLHSRHSFLQERLSGHVCSRLCRGLGFFTIDFSACLMNSVPYVLLAYERNLISDLLSMHELDLFIRVRWVSRNWPASWPSTSALSVTLAQSGKTR